MFDINCDTVSIPGFFQPFVCSCFIGSQEICCNFFLQNERTHYNFCIKKVGEEFKVSRPLIKMVI